MKVKKIESDTKIECEMWNIVTQVTKSAFSTEWEFLNVNYL